MLDTCCFHNTHWSIQLVQAVRLSAYLEGVHESLITLKITPRTRTQRIKMRHQEKANMREVTEMIVNDLGELLFENFWIQCQDGIQLEVRQNIYCHNQSPAHMVDCLLVEYTGR